MVKTFSAARMAETINKWLTEADDYVCTLSEETQLIAKNELREDQNSREQSIAAVREWIMNNPRIANCRLDSNFILRFLRCKKFSVLQAQAALERYILLKQSYGAAFCSLDIRIPQMEELTDLGFAFCCPKRDSKGRRVVICRPGVFDVNKYMNADMLRFAGIVSETLMEDEENQIRGFVYVADGQGVGLSYLSLFTPKEAVRLVKNGEKTLPTRHKEVHGINVHSSVKFLLDFGLSLVSEKIRKRVNIHSSLDDLIKSGTVEVDILPKEYGGIMPMAEMIALWKEELLKSHKTLMMNDEMRVKEELYSMKAREGAISALKAAAGVSCGSEEDAVYGVTGNFRKLEVD